MPTPLWNSDAFAFDLSITQHRVYNYVKQSDLIAISFFRHLRSIVIEKKFALLVSFDGRSRAGKSITACTLGCLLDSTFEKNFERRIVREIKEFYGALEEIERQKIEGGVVMVDEAGITMSSADFYERWNRAIFKTMQVFGYLHPIILFISPVKEFVDSRLRKLTNYHFAIKRYNNKETTIFPYEVLYSSLKQKYFYKKPVIRVLGNEIIVNRIQLSRPPEWIIKKYGEIEVAFKSKVIKTFGADVLKEEITQKAESISQDEIIKYVVENYNRFLAKKSKPDNIKLDPNKIRFVFRRSLTFRDAQYISEEAVAQISEKIKKVNGNTNDYEDD